MNTRQKIFFVIVVVANVWAWASSSDVASLVARDRHTLLGRYSRTHFTTAAVVSLISVVGFYVDWAPSSKYRRRWFQVMAVLLFATPVTIVVDFLLRRPETAHYIRDSLAYHRPPNSLFSLEFADEPVARRTYPNKRPGYGAVHCVYHSDFRGFRNETDASSSDIVVIGDSFAEGSNVSDEHAWPQMLAEASGRSVVNLGMSGYAPTNYLAALEEYGLPLGPRLVVCMIYEGNDFRLDEQEVLSGEEPLGDRARRYVKQSPIIKAVDRLMIETFGPIGADGPFEGQEVFSWMPVSVPSGEAARYYAFEPKQILQHKDSVDAFRLGAWSTVAPVMRAFADACANRGSKVLIVFAPTKAHVILPLARDRLPADKVRSFAALRASGLPEPEALMKKLFDNLPAQETVVEDWCDKNDVGFLSVTSALRNAASRGEQVYYTYDQHWTPIGHRVVARTVAAFIGSRGSDDAPSTNAS